MTSSYTIALIEGDGIGPEVVSAAQRVMAAATNHAGITLDYRPVLGGDSALARTGEAVPPETRRAFEATDACFKGPVGETVADVNQAFRFGYDLYANIRPARSYPNITPPALRPDIDLVVVRENVEGFYRGLETEVAPEVWTSIGVFTGAGWRRVARLAFAYARRRAAAHGRPAQVTVAHKANVFRGSHGLYVRAARELAGEYPDVRLTDYYADALCARLVREPHLYDVIVAENLLADLLSDLAGQVAGGLGLTAGTNMNYETRRAYFEPTHGSAPDIVGSGRANPIGQIRSGALMLEFLGMTRNDPRCLQAADLIERAIEQYLSGTARELLPIELGGRSRTEEVGSRIGQLVGAHA